VGLQNFEQLWWGFALLGVGRVCLKIRGGGKRGRQVEGGTHCRWHPILRAFIL